MSPGGGSFVVKEPSLESSDILRDGYRTEAEWPTGDGSDECALIHVQQANVDDPTNAKQDRDIRRYRQHQRKRVGKMTQCDCRAADYCQFRNLGPGIIDTV